MFVALIIGLIYLLGILHLIYDAFRLHKWKYAKDCSIRTCKKCGLKQQQGVIKDENRGLRVVWITLNKEDDNFSNRYCNTQDRKKVKNFHK